jgi:hypothetical protein
MTAAPKKKYQAKSTSLEEESRAKKKAREEEEKPKQKTKPRADEDEDENEKLRARKKPRDDDEADEKPKARKKSRDDDEDDDDSGGDDYDTDGKAAKQLGLDPGFKNRALMKQVTGELSHNETLHYVCRPSPEIAQKQGMMAMLGGIFFAVFGGIIAAVLLTVGSSKVPTLVVIVPCIFVLIGIAMAILGPIMKKRQARLGWYAVTDRRAIVFHIALWGSSGKVTVYQPGELRRMWVKKSFWLKGGGDLVFKTRITTHTTRERDAHGHVRTSTSTTTEHFGFLGIADVKDVEALIHEVLLSGGRRDDDDDDDDD